MPYSQATSLKQPQAILTPVIICCALSLQNKLLQEKKTRFLEAKHLNHD